MLFFKHAFIVRCRVRTVTQTVCLAHNQRDAMQRSSTLQCTLQRMLNTIMPALQCMPQAKPTSQAGLSFQPPTPLPAHPVLRCLPVLLSGLPLLSLNGLVTLRSSPAAHNAQQWGVSGRAVGTAWCCSDTITEAPKDNIRASAAEPMHA
jgi:hypothetical protein